MVCEQLDQIRADLLLTFERSEAPKSVSQLGMMLHGRSSDAGGSGCCRLGSNCAGKAGFQVKGSDRSEAARQGLELNSLPKASKNMEKKTGVADFLIDVEYRKVVISNSSGNYNTLSALH